MKVAVAVLVVVLGVILAIVIVRRQTIPIDRPCRTFVEEYAPRKTPALERSDGQLWLTLSYTPAPDAEASRVDRATLLGERTFEVSATGRRFRAVGDDHHLRIRVTADEVPALLKDLCFVR